MPEDLLALVARFGSSDPDERRTAVYDAYTWICHQAQTVYPESLATIDPLVALAVDPACPGRADALKLLADIAGSTNSAPEDHAAARGAVQRRLGEIAASVTVSPTAATAVALAQLAWSYPEDRSIAGDTLTSLLSRFDEASVVLAVALALQTRGDADVATFAFDAAFGEVAANAV